MEAGARGGVYSAPLTLEPLLLPLHLRMHHHSALHCVCIPPHCRKHRVVHCCEFGCCAMSEERMWGLPSLN